jgi:hypothetical protein
VERLLKAMRSVHPQTVRQFFALVNRHMRWELNDLAAQYLFDANAPESKQHFAETAAFFDKHLDK